MKITEVETLYTEEFSNVIWVRVHTDAGITGLGETFFGPGSVTAHVHEVLAHKLLGRDPLAIEAINREMVYAALGFSSSGAEMRAASAVDIALWDLFGKVCNLPVHQMLGGLSHQRLRIYNTCANPRYAQARNFRPVDNWASGQGDARYADLDGFMHRAGELAEDLLASGIGAMKIWPFDPPAMENDGRYITNEQLKLALEPFEKIRRAVGDRIEIMVELHSLWNLPTAKQIARALEPFQPTWFEDPIRMNSPQALAEFARSTPISVCASEVLATRFPYKDLLDRDATHVVMVDIGWCGGLTEARKIAALADTYHRPFAAHDCVGPVAFAAGVHASFSQPNTLIQESVRAYYNGWYKDLVTVTPRIEGGYVYPMEGPGLGTELRPEVFERGDLVRRVSRL